MAADKILRDLFAELADQMDKGTGIEAAVATGVVKQIGKALSTAMKNDQDFADRIAQIIDPEFMPSPVAIIGRSGDEALVKLLNGLAVSRVKKVATDRNLATVAEFKGMKKPEAIELLVRRAKAESEAQGAF